MPQTSVARHYKWLLIITIATQMSPLYKIYLQTLMSLLLTTEAVIITSPTHQVATYICQCGPGYKQDGEYGMCLGECCINVGMVVVVCVP